MRAGETRRELSLIRSCRSVAYSYSSASLARVVSLQPLSEVLHLRPHPRIRDFVLHPWRVRFRQGGHPVDPLPPTRDCWTPPRAQRFKNAGRAHSQVLHFALNLLKGANRPPLTSQ